MNEATIRSAVNDWFTIAPEYRTKQRLIATLMEAAEARRLFQVWSEMRRRCNMPSHKQYLDYGGRGIRVCDRWLSFDNFVADMGPRSTGGMLERVNNDLGYSPENCKWATRVEQNSNRRNCIYVFLDGEQVTLKEACRRKGLKYRPVVKRIQYRGWSIDRALSTPIGIGNTHAR